MSDSGTTSGAMGPHFSPARADPPISQIPWPTPSRRSRMLTRSSTTTIGGAEARRSLRAPRIPMNGLPRTSKSSGSTSAMNESACSLIPWAGSSHSTTAYATLRHALAWSWSALRRPAIRRQDRSTGDSCLGLTRTVKALALTAWYVAAWSWRSESKDKQAARYAGIAVTQEGVPAVRSRVKASMAGLPVPNDNVPHLERMFARTDLTDRLHEIRYPVLVLYGQRDAIMVAGAQMLTHGLTNVRSICLPQVGHEPFIEDPNAAFPAVREFLARLQF